LLVQVEQVLVFQHLVELMVQHQLLIQQVQSAVVVEVVEIFPVKLVVQVVAVVVLQPLLQNQVAQVHAVKVMLVVQVHFEELLQFLQVHVDQVAAVELVL
tara:strand:+ start:14 stop:313 length:300 start_codon:yes stop_codon:yes gene_type:complete